MKAGKFDFDIILTEENEWSVRAVVNKHNIVKFYCRLTRNMKNVSSLKVTKTESPKTPGGISKSLLTPCRRLGLSRKWKRDGLSPFVSPLSGSTPNSAEVKIEKKESRKRKERVPDEETEAVCEDTPQTPIENDGVLDVDESDLPRKVCDNDDIVGTPSRSIGIPRKKSKTLLSSIISNKEKCCNEPDLQSKTHTNKIVEKNEGANNLDIENKVKDNVVVEAVSTPIRSKSKNKPKKYIPPSKSTSNVLENNDKQENSTIDIKENINEINLGTTDETVKAISPNELTKKCIVVIQKKIFKTDKKETKNTKLDKSKSGKNSQTLFDSDSDELPLAQLNKKATINNLPEPTKPEIITIDEDDDFTETKPVKVKILEHKNTSTTSLKGKTNPEKTSKLKPKLVEPKPIITNSFDDDEDFEFEKRTILIRKTYDKVSKPLKAKSTGSITQKDIDELKVRIETKKKMLLARAMTEDTAELRGLIKKWQKGCQDALMELMELMKTKFPEKHNMDYSEILQTLQIPTHLVGYDEENDCFNTPDDANIILSKFNDL